MMINSCKSRSFLIWMATLVCIITGCEKLVHIPEPINTITTTETFATDANATSAIIGIYSDMSWAQGNLKYANGGITSLCGLSADELYLFDGGDIDRGAFQNNQLLATNGLVLGILWTPIYSTIYKANAALEGLNGSSSLSSEIKAQLTGEAKFIRAFCYFYLVNLFGDVPLSTTPTWAGIATQQRSSASQVYEQIIGDLKDAQSLLQDNYMASGGERTRVNKWAATALLARTYLYRQQWDNAITEAGKVIDNRGDLKLATDLNTVFLKNSDEAIFQLELMNNYPYRIREAMLFLPYDSTSSPIYILSSPLLTAFEAGDLRRTAWVDSTHYLGTYYYYPYKYKTRQGLQNNITEYYTPLRLAEQYLVRAEAMAQKNDLGGAVTDINTLRRRAGLPALPTTLTQPELMAAIAQEKKIEFFTEWGHRWLDLKRTGKTDMVLGGIKPGWKSSAQLYPIPQAELQVNPNLTQNMGY